MNLLYGEKKTITEVFEYWINEGGELDVRVPGTNRSVSIVFVNKKFREAKYDFHGTYTRSHWHVLGAIEARIKELEEAMYAPVAVCR